jgi:hypothetical protein
MILYYDMWPNVNMPCGIKKKNINIKLVGTQICAYKPRLHTNLLI